MKNKKHYFKNQHGSLLVGAIVLIVIIGLLAATVVRLTVVSSMMTSDQLDSAKAFYIAQSGLEAAAYRMIHDDLSCSAVTGDAALTNISFGGGALTVIGTNYHPTPTNLTMDISSNSTIIPVSDISGYSSIGRMAIDGEVIDYYGTSTNPIACSGAAPCFTGALRGQDGTMPDSHFAGASVVQYACLLESTGAVPNLTSPIAKRSVSEQIVFASGHGWMVGNADSAGETILNWSGWTWSRSGPYFLVPNVTLRDIATATSTTAWAVGDKNNGRGTIAYWTGATWFRYLGLLVPNQNLNAISCPTSDKCFIVGDQRTLIRSQKILGVTVWFDAPESGVPNENFNDISCTSSTNCWAVGNKSGSVPVIIHWNGSQWTLSATGDLPAKNLLGIDCLDANDCWVVGQLGTIGHWNGSAWSAVMPPVELTTLNINSIDCMSSNDCWAVTDHGALGPLFAHWGGLFWTVMTGVGVTNSQLTGVSCAAADDCWAVGNNQSIVYWNGLQWTGITPGATVPNVHLRGVVFESGVVPTIAFWREIYH